MANDKKDSLRPQFKKTNKAFDKASYEICELAADALAVDPEITKRLGKISGILADAYKELDALSTEAIERTW